MTGPPTRAARRAHHGKNRDDLSLQCVEDPIRKSSKQRAANPAVNLSVKLWRLNNGLELLIERFEELEAKTGMLFLIPLVRLNDLESRTVGDC